MPAATLVSSAFSDPTNQVGTTRTTTTSASWSAGDEVFVLGMTEDNAQTITTPTTGGANMGTVTAVGSTPTNTASSCKGYAWRATATGSGSGTWSTTIGTTQMGIICVWGYSGCGGLGNTGILVNTSDVVSLIRGGANSSVVWIGGDWGATNDVVVTADPTGTIDVAGRVAGLATMFAAHYGDQGAPGTTSYGLLAASFTTASNLTKIALEVLGSGSAGQPYRQTPTPGQAVRRASRW